jgi:Tfp pilus assembly protein PilP
MAMKVSTNVFALLLSASVAFAQTGAAPAPAKPAGGAASKSTAGAKTLSSTKKAGKAATGGAVKPAAAAPKTTPFAHKPSAPAAQPELKPAVQEVKPAAAVTPPPAAPPVQVVKPYSSANKRDPFISPIQVATTGVGACTGGKRCLIINQITLRGIVKSVNGWIAVVENPAQKTYFLHENDAVMNGFVSRITGETVVFKENMVDALGQQTQRDVVKYVSAPVV